MAESGEGNIERLDGQPCPMCNKNTLTLIEQEREIPYFGVVYLFSMNCKGCGYHKADIEAAEKKDPCKYTLDVKTEEDLKIRIVKSGEATLKIPRIMTISPGPASNGYITNVEGNEKEVEIFLHKQLDDTTWDCLVFP